MGERAVAVASGIRRLVLGLWLGSTTFFGLVTAPTLFRVMRSAGVDRRSPAPDAMAGDVVVPNLQAVAWLGLVCALIALFTLWAERPRARIFWQAVVLLGGVACIVASMGWLTPTMLDLQQQMNGPIDAMPVDHPLRVRFRGLHGFSSGLHLGMMLAAAFGLLFEPAPLVRKPT
jgi:hypothetical protein